MYDYRGTVSLVTGASTGLGAAYADELARRGSALVLVARRAAALDEVAARIRVRHGVQVTTLPADLGRPEDVTALLEEIDRRDRPVDLVVNNAGMSAVGPFLDGRPDRDLDSIALNVTALVTLTHGFGRRMAARGRGGIINVASTAAFQPMPFQATYGAGKAFVLSFTEALAEELRGGPVRVMAAHPGATATGFFDRTSHTMDAAAADPADRVAARTLDDFARGRPASYPGRPAFRAMTWLPRLVSRRLAARLAGGFNRRSGVDRATNAPGAAGHTPTSSGRM
ncbi:SDR family oxidoreductase [Pseudonocardia nematodicida]|uniref:SDR family oxidoreductase n=1 Tax=Pseudonocardia nematodicida TaxID=1206997 RepID=A0ABV1KER1_9PSEU